MNQEEQEAQAQAEQREQQQAQEAITELITKWGYRDVTGLLRLVYEQEAWGEFNYLCVLQSPEGGPVYCAQPRRLFKELTKARNLNVQYEMCPAPDPKANLWMIVGNFEVDEDDEEVQA